MVQFDTLNFRKTVWNYFGQFVWIEKSHFMKRRLKIKEGNIYKTFNIDTAHEDI